MLDCSDIILLTTKMQLKFGRIYYQNSLPQNSLPAPWDDYHLTPLPALIQLSYLPTEHQESNLAQVVGLRLSSLTIARVKAIKLKKRVS